MDFGLRKTKQRSPIKMSDSVTIIKILVCGGSFGGKTFLNKLYYDKLKPLQDLNVQIPYKFEVTLVDPRSGFINILAIPRAIMSPSFAKETYAVDLEIPFGDDTDLYHFKFEHARVIKFDSPHSAVLQRVGDGDDSQSTSTVEFDYCIFATGRSRPWPFDPNGYTYEGYLQEMQESFEKISGSDTITVVGGGAVGIETALELKSEFPEKRIILVHPYDNLPPEDLQESFKKLVVEKLIDLKVELRLQSRVARQVDDGFYSDSGEFVKSDLVLWCGSKKNNLSPLIDSGDLFKDCIDFKTYEVTVNDRLQIVRFQEDSFNESEAKDVKYDHFFAVGDVLKVPVIKAAGGAYRMADIVASNLFNKFARSLLAERKDLKINFDDQKLQLWSNGMLLLVGPGYVVKDRDGEVLVNDPLSEKVYLDYCNGFVSTYYNVVFKNVEKWN